MPELLYTAKVDGYLHRQTPLVYAVCSSHYEMTSEDYYTSQMNYFYDDFFLLFCPFRSQELTCYGKQFWHFGLERHKGE